MPALAAALSLPLFMMGGLVRPAIGGVLLAGAAVLIWRAQKRGWQVDPSERLETLPQE